MQVFERHMTQKCFNRLNDKLHYMKTWLGEVIKDESTRKGLKNSIDFNLKWLTEFTIGDYDDRMCKILEKEVTLVFDMFKQYNQMKQLLNQIEDNEMQEIRGHITKECLDKLSNKLKYITIWFIEVICNKNQQKDLQVCFDFNKQFLEKCIISDHNDHICKKIDQEITTIFDTFKLMNEWQKLVQD